jgi:hypothetical protein
MRPEIFSLVGITILNRGFTLNNTQRWLAYQLNPLNASILKEISLVNITSSFKAEISIPSCFLQFGLYKFIFQVQMNGSGFSFKESVETFFEIVNTGIAIFPFSGGVDEKTIERKQSIDLDPGMYSLDFDELLTGHQLNYKYFCRKLINGIEQEFPANSSNVSLDLQQIK